MKAAMSADIPYWEIVDAEPVILAIVATETVIGNSVAVVAAPLLPGAVFRLPAMRTRTLPCNLLLADLGWTLPSGSNVVPLLTLLALLISPPLVGLLLFCSVVLLLALLALLILLASGLLLFRGVVLLLSLLPLLVLLPLGLLLPFRLRPLLLFRRFALFFLFIRLVLPSVNRRSDPEHQKKRRRTDDSNWFQVLPPLNFFSSLALAI